ncbi:MAG: beta/gamma crystallin-related protein [Bacteroidetes bacterium]|nr:beta/gamma crystallin-related protein [Bacteroidota bacterium]
MNRFFAILILCFTLVVGKAQQVTLFADCNFRGYSVNLPPGNYTAAQHGMRIRDLSAINIPPGMSVNLFTQDFFNGHYITLNRSTACLLNEQFNDQMVSIQVMNNGFVNQYPDAPVIFYNRCNYQGNQEPLQEGTYYSIPMGFITIQAMRVAPGFGVIVRKETGFGSNIQVINEEYRADQNCLKILWGAAVKAVFVYRLGNVNPGNWSQVPNPPPPAQNFQQGAVVYTDPFFRGRTQLLYPGAYRGYQLTQVGENAISSIMLAPGYRAIAFTGSNFDGASIIYNSSNNNLHSGYPSWGNRIRSIIVERLSHQPNIIQPITPPPPPPPVINNNSNSVIMYADANFRGAAQAFPIGNYRGYQLNVVGQRTISSLSVPPGLKVVAYEGPEYNGASREIERTVDNLVQEGLGWNDRISSFIVQRNNGAPAPVIGRPEPVMPPNGMPPARPQPSTNSQPSGVFAYADSYFSGAVQQLMMGHTNGSQLNLVGQRTISSIKIPPGIKVTVYEGANFDGDFRILSYTIDNFAAEGQGRWNDRIGSMIVEIAN